MLILIFLLESARILISISWDYHEFIKHKGHKRSRKRIGLGCTATIRNKNYYPNRSIFACPIINLDTTSYGGRVTKEILYTKLKGSS